MKTIFLDTNIFIQCRDLKELPWKDVVDKEDILLLIPQTVVKEIDKQKGEGGNRRGKRARATSTLFRKIITCGETRFVIKESNPRIEIAFSDITLLKVDPNDALDPSQPDDRIIAEVRQYQLDNQGVTAHFLTHDSYPMHSCQRLGIPFIPVPDAWLLEPEPDPHDKELKELRQKIAKLEQNDPKIELTTRDSDDCEISTVTLEITDYVELTEDQIKELVAEVVTRCPIKTHFDGSKKQLSNSHGRYATLITGYQEEYQKPSESQIEKYQNEDYPAWVEKVHKNFKNFHKILGFNQRHFSLTFELSNNGSVPAGNLIIEFEALGDIEIMLKEHKNDFFGDTTLKPPSAPKAPEGQWIKKNLGFAHSNVFGLATRLDEPLFKDITPFINPRRERDLNSFYWREGETCVFTKGISAECKEFRHQVNPELFEITVIIPMDKKLRNGGISCLVTAKNLRIPFKKVLPISLSTIQANNTIDIAKKLLNKTFPIPLKFDNIPSVY